MYQRRPGLARPHPTRPSALNAAMPVIKDAAEGLIKGIKTARLSALTPAWPATLGMVFTNEIREGENRPTYQ